MGRWLRMLMALALTGATVTSAQSGFRIERYELGVNYMVYGLTH